jgi:hypothetical protein
MFFVDDSGNVGIGTTSPSETLHLIGSSRSVNSVFDTNSVDGAAWGQSLFKFGSKFNTDDTNEFCAAVQAFVDSTTSTSGYEKAALIVEARTADGSTSFMPSKDVVGIQTSGTINGTTWGRVWGMECEVAIGTSSDPGPSDPSYPVNDGQAIGLEIGINNYGSDASTFSSPKAKCGLGIVAGGTINSTCAINIVAAGPTWHKGLVSDQANFASSTGADDNFIELTASGSVVFAVKPDGKVGIGTASPSQSLEVDGVIYSTSGGFKFPDGTIQTTAGTSSGLTIGFIINDGSAGTGVGPTLISPRTDTVSTCKLVTKASDLSTALIFRINQNGTSIFTSNQTIAAGTAAGTLTTITALTSSPLTVTADDLFTIDIIQGSSTWAFTVQIET